MIVTPNIYNYFYYELIALVITQLIRSRTRNANQTYEVFWWIQLWSLYHFPQIFTISAKKFSQNQINYRYS